MQEYAGYPQCSPLILIDHSAGADTSGSLSFREMRYSKQGGSISFVMILLQSLRNG